MSSPKSQRFFASSCVGKRLVAAYQLARHARARAALAEAVLDRLHLHVVPVGEERGEDPAVVRHVAVPVGRAFPDAHRGKMGRLQRRDVPLVHAVVGDAVQPHLAARPRLHARPLDAVVEILRFPRREVVDVARRAAGAARIHAHARVAVRHPLLRVDDLPALVEIARAIGDVGMLGDHALPRARVAVLEREALRVGAVGEDDRVAAVRRRAEHVGAQDEAVFHRDRRRPSRCACRRGLRSFRSLLALPARISWPAAELPGSIEFAPLLRRAWRCTRRLSSAAYAFGASGCLRGCA